MKKIHSVITYWHLSFFGVSIKISGEKNQRIWVRFLALAKNLITSLFVLTFDAEYAMIEANQERYEMKSNVIL